MSIIKMVVMGTTDRSEKKFNILTLDVTSQESKGVEFYFF